MKKALLMTVGTGSGTENGIFTSLRLNNPTLVAFLVSKESIHTLERRASNAGGKTIRELCENKIIELPTAEDIDEVFQKCEYVYHQLLNENFVPSEVVVDITFGTKVMTAALTALAGIHGLDMTYVSGTRESATVKTGTERPVVMKPGRILRRYQLENMKSYFARYQFPACLELAKQELEQVNLFSSANATDGVERASALVEFVEGFVYWERFDHKEAVSRFCNLESVVAQRNYLGELLSDYAKTASVHKGAKGNIPSRYLIIDLFCNAKRRASEENFDDAVARLYRCIEMTIQYSLAETQEISTGNVELSILEKKTSSATLERLSKRSENQVVKLGLVDGFDVLKESSPVHPLSLAYPQLNEELKKLLGFRNNSILAHGVKPVGKDEYEKMAKLTEEFVRIVVGGLLDEVSSKIDECFAVENLDYFIRQVGKKE